MATNMRIGLTRAMETVIDNRPGRLFSFFVKGKCVCDEDCVHRLEISLTPQPPTQDDIVLVVNQCPKCGIHSRLELMLNEGNPLSEVELVESRPFRYITLACHRVAILEYSFSDPQIVAHNIIQGDANSDSESDNEAPVEVGNYRTIPISYNSDPQQPCYFLPLANVTSLTEFATAIYEVSVKVNGQPPLVSELPLVQPPFNLNAWPGMMCRILISGVEHQEWGDLNWSEIGANVEAIFLLHLEE